MRFSQHIFLYRVAHHTRIDRCQAGQGEVTGADAHIHLLPPRVHVERSIVIAEVLEVDKSRLPQIAVGFARHKLHEVPGIASIRGRLSVEQPLELGVAGIGQGPGFFDIGNSETRTQEVGRLFFQEFFTASQGAYE